MGNSIKFSSSWLVKSIIREKTNETERHPANFTEQPKAYSWDKRRKCSADQFYITGLNSQFYYRDLTKIDHDQCLYIQNCFDSLILITGRCDAVLIDNCGNCRFILGLVNRSVFLRDCTSSLVACMCGQFRMRDCSGLSCFLFCTSQPTIEASTKIRFGCISISYPTLNELMQKYGHGLPNQWSDVFDFTPNIASTGENLNWKLIDDNTRDLMSHLNDAELQFCLSKQVNFLKSESAVPFSEPKDQKLENSGIVKVEKFDN